jgi:hypothetical protein
MLPAISDFFSKTLTESLTKLLQPAGLIGSSILIILNLLFIFPGLVEKNVPLAVDILNFSPALQVVLVVSFVLLIAYLLLSFQNSILKIFTGEVWANSPLLGHFFAEWQRAKMHQLEDQAKQQPKLAEKNGNQGTPEQGIAYLKNEEPIYWRKLTHYPKEEENVAPTALGNVLNAINSYLWNRYHIDMTALWPHMKAVMGSDKTLGTSIDNEKATLDFLVSLTFLLLLFTVEVILVQFFFFRQGLAVLWALLPLLLAYIVYQATVRQARTWGDVVQLAFDTHRDDLRKLLNVRPFKSVKDENNVWHGVSSWLLWGSSAEGLFPEPSMPTPSIFTSADIKATIQAAQVDVPDVAPSNQERQPTIKRAFQNREYLILVDRADTAQPKSDGTDKNAVQSKNTGVLKSYILISDPNLPVIWDAPELKDWNNKALEMDTPQVIHTSGASAADFLLLHLTLTLLDNPLMLRYSLSSRILTATTSEPSSLDIKQSETSILDLIDYIKCKFTIRNRGEKDVMGAYLDVLDDRIPLSQNLSGTIENSDPIQNPTLVQNPTPSSSGVYRWELGNIARGQYVTLTYQTTVKEG